MRDESMFFFLLLVECDACVCLWGILLSLKITWCVWSDRRFCRWTGWFRWTAPAPGACSMFYVATCWSSWAGQSAWSPSQPHASVHLKMPTAKKSVQIRVLSHAIREPSGKLSISHRPTVWRVLFWQPFVFEVLCPRRVSSPAWSACHPAK